MNAKICSHRRDGTRNRPVAFSRMKESDMPENEMPYTVEQLQQKYAVSLHVAVEVLEHFRGDRLKIDKFMKRCPNRDDEKN